MNRVTPLSSNEKEFILKALEQQKRVDGRGPFDYRTLNIQFSLDDGSATILMGMTRAMAVVTAEIGEPYPDRPSEGTIQFRVEFSPMASQEFEPGRPGEAAVEVARIIERSLRDSRAMDMESLVILSGMKVWHVKCDVHVLDHDGNLTDACTLAAVSALTAFRRPDVTVGGATGKELTVHPKEIREPVPLTIHHIPLAVTIALFQDGVSVLVDPNLKEEATMSGHITCVMNKQNEICSLQKGGRIGVRVTVVDHCISIAAQKVVELTDALDAALVRHNNLRVQSRVRRHAGPVPSAGPTPMDEGPPMTGKGKWRAAAVAMRVLESQGDMAQGASDVSSSDQEDAVAIKEESEEEEEEGQQGGEEERGGGAARQVKLPQGGLLKPAVVRAAGLTAPKAKNTPGGKPKGTCKPGGEKGISTVDDDFADIAAVIAQAASKSGREAAAEGLEGAIKAPKKVKKTRHDV